MKLYLMLLLCSFTGTYSLYSQVACNTPGQNPSTAFPVCGTSTFIQSSVNLCGGRKVPNPKCGNGLLTDINPYWYKFTCFKDGTLGFTIDPNSPTSDYDWQVFDITGRNPDEVFLDPALTISSNWSQYFGPTGTTATAANQLECEGPVPQFSKMPNIIAGHTYLLLVSHFTNTQAGYKLQFGGGTAVITDTTQPQMKSLAAGCNGTQFYLKLNKKMKCSSVAADGSDWEFFSGNVPIASAVGIGCNNGFETDSIVITTASPVPPGTFALRSKKGSDGNTMLDICDAPLPEGQTLVVNVLPAAPTAIDKINPVQCKPAYLELVMKDPITCASIANDGSDFTLAGPQPLQVVGIDKANCQNGETKTIRLQLSAPITVEGVYTVTVQRGTDGNTLVNGCAKETPVGSSTTVQGYNTVNVDFESRAGLGCQLDTLFLSLSNPTPNTQYTWHFNGQKFTGPSPVSFTHSPIDDKTFPIGLTATNGVCQDSALGTWKTLRNNILQARATTVGPAFACPDDVLVFADSSLGTPVSWLWNFGNGQTSTAQSPPPQSYPPNPQPGVQEYIVRLQVTDATGCQDVSQVKIQVPNNCYIAVPTGFTPNGDGLNDYLYPLNAWKAENLLFRVYNRYGQLVWQTRDWTRKWDGRINGVPQESGTYVWYLSYTLLGEAHSQKGTIVLIR